MNNGGCEHNCVNTDGSYHCTCHNGYDIVGHTNCTGENHKCLLENLTAPIRLCILILYSDLKTTYASTK